MIRFLELFKNIHVTDFVLDCSRTVVFKNG